MYNYIILYNLFDLNWQKLNLPDFKLFTNQIFVGLLSGPYQRQTLKK